MNKGKLLAGLLAIAVSSSLTAAPVFAKTTALKPGSEAPDFTAELADGSEFTLSEAEDTVVLLNFWATWCGPCVEEMPAFQKLDEEYGDEVQILAVNCMEDQATVDAFIDEYEYTFPVAYDLDASIESLYPTLGIPYTVVIGQDGVITKVFMGSMGMEQQYHDYKEAIDAALGADTESVTEAATELETEA